MSAKTSRCLFICSLKRLSMLFVVLSPLILNAQPNRYLDSLHQLVETTDDDSAKLRGLSRLIIAYEDSAPSKALTFAEKALVLTAKMKSQFLQAVIHNQYGAVSMNTGQLEDAQKHFLAADSLFRLEGRLDRLGDVYLNLGSVIAQQEQYPKARGYMKQAIDIYKEEEDLPRVGIAQGLVGLSYVYQDSLTKGIGYLRQSYRQAKSLGVPQLQITPVTNLGFAYLKQHKNDSALVWIAIGKRLSDSLKSQSEFLTNLNNEASVYENQKRYAQSIAVAKEGEALAVKWGFPNKQIELLETLHLAYAGAAQKDLAYAVLTRYQTLKDSLDGVSEAEQIAELDARFQNQQQRYQIERLEDEQAASDSQMRIILIAAAIVIALLALVAFLARRSAFQRRKANALLVQQTEQLQQLDETKSRFFANLSHELRTPLSLILGPLQEAEKDEAIQADPGLHKHLHLARQNTEKLLQLVNEIMELSSLEAGKASLHLSDFNLQDMLKRCFYAFESSASLDQIRLVVDDKTAEPLWVKGDAVKLEKVLNNLVSNALKHSPKGSQIILEISKVNDRLEIAVQDAGPGIHPDDIPHVFERFFQSNQPGIPIQG
ncbi:MAG: ATP-binding protein, partial [Bacteroidia bacterium]